MKQGGVGCLKCVTKSSFQQNSAVEGMELAATVLDEHGKRLRKQQLRFKVEGNGTFAGGTAVSEMDERCNDDGEALITWWEYPRYVPRREITATVKAICDVLGCQLSFRRVKTIYRI